MSSDNNFINELIKYFQEREEDTFKSLPKYRGWVLIPGYQNESIKICKDFEKYRELFEQKGYRIRKWSYLSGDKDDERDIAITKIK